MRRVGDTSTIVYPTPPTKGKSLELGIDPNVKEFLRTI